MSSETIIITIGDAIVAQVEVQGVGGPGCAEKTADIQRALGHTIADHKKPEFAQRETAARAQSAGVRR